ncbi:hypothetical protein AAG570_009413 [Ranatra chinensis]|uniref:Tetrapyrrole biosynthesis uroporphyrinogen III synthase domain-containing protein n=1 Tax=Ranatra chinensis TaxID=642074 RepID=A0ABD0YP39_9HEMI
MSPRTVRAVAQCGPLKEEWKQLKSFAVGAGTQMYLKSDLDLDAEGGQTGSGAKLATFILQSKFDRPLLLPCGNLSGDSLQRMLEEGGVSVDALEVYKTNPHPELEKNMKAALGVSFPDYALYFSPSGIDSTFPIFEKLGLNMDLIKVCEIFHFFLNE